MAGVTLVAPTAATDHDAAGACVAAWADEAAWPTSAAHGFGAAGFGAEALKELGQRHVLLELDGVVSHSVGSWLRCHQLTTGSSPDKLGLASLRIRIKYGNYNFSLFPVSVLMTAIPRINVTRSSPATKFSAPR